ncbi:MAG: MBL fold metallo-hydrolase, partial [Halothiobacillaceae bacterium]
LEKSAPGSLWVPAHGRPDRNLLAKNRELLGGIYENALKAVQNGKDIEEAKKMVLTDPHVAKYAHDTVGFNENIGKFTSIAYVEAEQTAF